MSIVASHLVQALLAGLLLGPAAASQISTKHQVNQQFLANGSTSEGKATIVQEVGARPHDLMICNAYADKKAIDAIILPSQTKLTLSGPLEYKSCANYEKAVQEGEEIEFRAGSLNIGTFKATGLPKSPASLLLVTRRRSPTALNAAFASHAFADVPSSQLVVIDTYGGHGTGSLKIQDAPQITGKEKAQKEEPRTEDLTFNSVLQVNPGDYELMLQDSDKNLNKVPLHVPDQKANFVLLRTGNDAKSNLTESFPQELVLSEQRSGAQAAARLQLLAFAVALFAGLASRS